MATAFNTTMLYAITRLWAPKVPTTEIAGVALAHGEAVQLMHTCTALNNALNLQIGGIDQMPNIPPERIVSRSRKIQTRHINIHIRRTLMDSKTTYSNVSWVRESGDAQAALECRIIVINRRSGYLGG